MMIGRDLPHTEKTRTTVSTGARLSLTDLSFAPDAAHASALDSVSLEVHGGEVVGIAGVSGNGQNTLASLLSGEKRLGPAQAAKVRIDGQPSAHLGPNERRRRGLHFIPEERLGRGAVPIHDLSHNSLLTGYASGLSRFGFLNHPAMQRFAFDTIETFDVRCGGPNAEAQSLSGGNLQKFIVGREITLQPKVLIVSQPTWGVDVGAASAIRQKLVDLSRAGTAVVVISEELDELFEITDRLHVMFRGRLSAAVPTAQTSVDAVGLAMTGAFEALNASVDRVAHA